VSVIFFKSCFTQEQVQRLFDGMLEEAESERLLVHWVACEACAVRMLEVMQFELLADLNVSEDRQPSCPLMAPKRVCVSGPVGGGVPTCGA